MIRARCRTNIDLYQREEWPKHVSDNIQIGHHVSSKSGVRLKVVDITHSEREVSPDGDYSGAPLRRWEPVLVVELHTDDGHVPMRRW